MSEEVSIYNRRGFSLQPANMDEALRMAEMLSRSQMIPKAYQGKPQDALVAMMMGSELGLNPIQSLQNIALVNGKPSIFGDALAALMLNHPAFGGMEEDFDDASQTAKCTVWRKGGPRHTQSFSEADARKAGLWGKAGPWAQYPKRMLQMRARGFAIRSQFADALAGLITREEAEDMPVERNITPMPNSVPLDIPPQAPVRQPEPLPATPAATPSHKLAVLLNADGSIHSEHAAMGEWLAAYEDLIFSGGMPTATDIARNNAAVLGKIAARGVYDVHINRINSAMDAATLAQQDDVGEL